MVNLKQEIRSYVAAIALVLIALLLMLVISPYISLKNSFLIFHAALTLAAWYGGRKAGIVATLLSAIFATYFFVEPPFGWSLSVENSARVALFVLQGGLISVLVGSLRAAQQQSQHSLKLQEAALREQEIALRKRDRAEAQLRRSESILRNAIAVAQFSPYEWYPLTGKLVWDAGLRAMWGLPPDAEVNYQVFAAGLHPDDRAYVEQEVAKALDPNGDGIYRAEFRVIGITDGIERWVLALGQTVFDATGRPVHFVGAAQDITDRKRAEEVLRRNQEMFSVLVANAPFGVYLVDSEFRLQQINEGAEAVFRNITPLIGRDFAEILRIIWQEPFATEAIDRFRHTLATGESYYSPPIVEQRADIDEIQSYDWQIHRITLPDGSSGVVCYFYDLSEIKRAEEIVRHNANRAAFLVTLNDVLRPLTDPLEIQSVATRILGEQLGANRVTYFEVQGSDYVVEQDYVNGVPNIRGRYPVESFGAELTAVYRSGRTAIASDIEADPDLSEAERAAYAAVQIRAYIGVPLIKAGEFVAGLAVHAATPRLWTPNEIAMVEETAERTWDAVARARAEAALREADERFRLMVESAKDYAIFTLDLNGLITSWNSGAERLLGYTETEAIGREGRIIFTPEDREQKRPEWEIQTALTEGRAVNERWHLRRDGSRFWASGLMMPLQNETGDAQGFVKILQDKTASRHAAEREQFLSNASAALAASIDYKTTLMTIAQLAVPFLADYCYFDVINPTGQIERVAWHIADPALQDWFEQVQQFIPPQDFDSHPVASVLRSGQARLVPDVTSDWMQTIATSPEHLQFMQQCQLRSLLTVPLTHDHRALGALTFCYTTRSHRHYTQTDLTLAEELARRAALALDNAKLYHQSQEANRIKDEFLAVLSHELRSPLNPILGWTRLLQGGKLDATRQREALATIERNARLQTQLIEDLLDISRIMRGKLSLTVAPVSLEAVIPAARRTVPFVQIYLP